MRRRVRILLGILGLALILVGPPLLLWTFRTVFLPDHVPALQEVVGWFTERDTGGVFLLVMTVAGVVAWFQLIVAVVLECIAFVRGVAAPRLPGFRWAQRLVAGILFGLVVGTTAAEASQPVVVGSASIAAPQVSDQRVHRPASSGESGETPAAGGYTVVPGDSLMSIAAGQLGDENRYQEIFDLNHGRRQADGEALRSVDLIKPGWHLVLPPGPQCVEVVIGEGDTLTEIAQKYLNSAARYIDIYHLNQGRQQPGGRILEDPNLIHPGDVLQLPRPGKPANGGGAAPAGAVSAQVSTQDCRPGTGPATAPPASRTPEPNSSPPQRVPAPAPAPVEVALDSEDSIVPLVAAGLGGLLAAGILTTLARRRMIAQRRRRPGHRIRRPATSSDLETALRKVEEPATAEMLDSSLRALAQHASQVGRGQPAIRSAIVGSRGVVLHPQQPGEALKPFATVSENVWQLDTSTELVNNDGLAPYPALVSLGHDFRRDLVLVNLLEIRALALTGPVDEVEAVLLAMAWELSASTWAEGLTVMLVGFGESTAAYNSGRLQFVETLDEAIDGLEHRTSSASEIVLSAASLNTEQQERLAKLELIGGRGTGRTAVVSSAPLPGAWQLDVSRRPTPVDVLDLDVDLQRLTSEQAEELVAALTATDTFEQAPADDYRNVPPESDELPEPVELVVGAWEASEHEQFAGPELRLLGPVCLHGVDLTKVEGKKVNRLTELAAFLLLHPGATADEISRQLGTDTQPWSASTRQGYISRLRTWLGRDHNGDLYLPNVEANGGGYRLSDTMANDWRSFRQLVHLGFDQDPANRRRHLQVALDLVTGMPFGNVAQGRYAWSSWFQREMIDTIVDVAHTLFVVYQEDGNLTACRRAILRGLAVEPVSELLYRDLLRVEYRAGNLAAVKDAADKLTGLAAALDVELDDETAALMEKVLAPRGHPSV
ncbi:LysM peptidoglycan-binding domain-containing protein [Amycolatopsis sp. lyj-90]|uniref:LysM peptidoglycan-binding domain-containing protein n=1 Tax=Amycolatopsis sp. lyj-90 TaxID=2789285 RepID=UPI00397A0AB6